MAPLVPVADGAVDCGSVGNSTARWSHVASGLYRGVSSLVTLLWQPSQARSQDLLKGGYINV